MKIAAKTDKGSLRPDNQDAFLYGIIHDNCAWITVCDGMGGSAAGNVASQNTVNLLSKSFEENIKPTIKPETAEKLLLQTINSANSAIYRMAEDKEEYHGMGTTVVAAIIMNGTVKLANVGDSRAYYIEQGNIRQLTTDHSIVQTMVENGQLTEDEAKIHPNKNIITRAVGVKPHVDVDIYDCTLQNGGTLLLCSDGLSNGLDDAKIAEIVENTPFEQAAQKLIDTAIENGSTDNITVALVQCD